MVSNSKPLLRVLKEKKDDYIPLWLMRQAGRYLPEYREIRSQTRNFLEFCYNPALASEVTLQPLRRFDFDAAIIFSDILVLPHALGVHVEFKENEGPVLVPIRNEKDIEQLNLTKIKEFLEPVYEAIRRTATQLPTTKTLIGFAGCPWTLACYMLEGRSSKDYAHAKAFAYTYPEVFQRLISVLEEAITIHLASQIEAGCEVVQLFDSWANVLPEVPFMEYAVKPVRRIVSFLKTNYSHIPVIGFPRGANIYYANYAKHSLVDAISIDTQTCRSYIANTIDPSIVLQGNLDPAILFASPEVISNEVKHILSAFKSRPFIFNLGHGILPGTPISNVEHLVHCVRNGRVE